MISKEEQERVKKLKFFINELVNENILGQDNHDWILEEIKKIWGKK